MASDTPTSPTTQAETPTPSRPTWAYRTDHLPHFLDFMQMTAVYGPGYTMPLKATFYSMIAAKLGPHIIQIGDVSTDSRINAHYVLPSGRGKLNIVRALHATKKLGVKVASPASYYPEQLIGKMVLRKKKIEGGGGFNKDGKPRNKNVEVLVPNPGYLYDDMLIFEEALSLFTSRQQEEKESRGHIARALDRIPDNVISKRLVDQLRGEGLEYVPTAQIYFVLQPIPIEEESFQQGIMRRPLIVYPILAAGDERKEEFTQRINGDAEKTGLAEEKFLQYLATIDSAPGSFAPECLPLIHKCHTKLYAFGRSFSRKLTAYTEIFAHTALDYLVKMAVLLAAARKHQRVEEEDVLLAHADLLEIYDSSLAYVNECVRGEVAYIAVNQATTAENNLLSYLIENGAVSKEESTISIDDFQNQIMDETGKKEPQSRTIYSRMKRKGLIGDTKGKWDSTVWALKKPENFVPASTNFSIYALSRNVAVLPLLPLYKLAQNQAWRAWRAWQCFQE